MNQKEIKELIDFLIEKDIAEFELERGDVKLRVKRGSQPLAVTSLSAPVATVVPAMQAVPVAHPISPPAPANAQAASVAAPAAPAGEDESAWQIVKSPIVGTFYESPSPGAPAFVKPGDSVTVGQVLCIVEAMKLMNEIESDYAGVVAKSYVTNGQPVEYGQPLFAIRPS
ncbi:MAG TPA: acetyl-CoA carboxylase biotin carboxyl carrier protein [Terriglobales bacterium]|nr:acetyl-CoA carboxylase biotin carboxyl carrier protein [Terriglobales bacterium]